ncbi:MAG: phosphoribosylamine--glycine ligase [Bacillota bacterium]
MYVMVVGSGGREHCLVASVAGSPLVDRVAALPGNAGMSPPAELVAGDVGDIEGVVDAARSRGVDLVVVGPENPLVDGLVDALGEAGIAAFGPSADAARIEGSKVFAKDLMSKYGIPTAPYRVFSDFEEAAAHLEERPMPAVIKADGLAAGKGVIVAGDRDRAREALAEIMVERRFGPAGVRVLIEDCLAGEELSVMAITDGQTLVPLAPSQDHKALLDGDRGPNTGGMGAYSPVPFCGEKLSRRIESEILRPAVEAMAREGAPFRGVLYAGLMITEAGPMVLEFNCRFGDPETQVVLPRLESDLVPLLLAASGAGDDLADLERQVRWRSESTVCVVLASDGYPGSYQVGLPIEGLEDPGEGVRVFHAGTRRCRGQWLTAGGRVVGVTALGDDLQRARSRVYRQIDRMGFSGMHYRTDIGQMS